MAKNPFKIPGLPGVPGMQSKLPELNAPNPRPELVGLEQTLNPEARRMRFRKLAALLHGPPAAPTAAPGLPTMPKLPKI